MMTSSLAPALPLVVGALLTPIFRKRWVRSAYLMLLTLASLANMWALPDGSSGEIALFSYTLTTIEVDRLSRIFGTIFHIAAFLNILYSFHVKDTLQQICGPMYAGAAIGAAFAGDLITLFVWWELTAIASVFLIWARRTNRSYRAGMRYLIVQVASGVLLLAGAILYSRDTGTIAFEHMTLGSLATWLIFLAFGIKCAFPFFHNWLQDAYPEATVTGTVWLSAFTTKLAIYALARGFAGTDILIPIGATMAAFPIFFAVIENDLRRVLAYSLNNQLGFMVVGIGVGTELAINGTAAHAFCHILYKALLFMSMGAVLYRTGTVKGSELGGLYKSMPWTTIFCCVGAASISAFPLFSGFVSKSLIQSATAENHHTIVWLILLFASAGVFHHSGIKIPFFAFFAHDSGKRCKEAPPNMLLAMGITATLCIGLGCYPAPLYALLPYAVDYAPYTTSHVITQLQVLLFSALAFGFLQRTGIYPPELRSTNLDTDVVYRHWLPTLWRHGSAVLSRTRATIVGAALAVIERLIQEIARHHGPQGLMARTWATGSLVFLGIIVMAAYLVLYLIL